MNSCNTKKPAHIFEPAFHKLLHLQVIFQSDYPVRKKIYMSIDDKELLYQFKQPAAKEGAFTAIVKKYREKLYWHIRRMVVDHEDANDVLQNMFIKVWNGLENFREDSQLYTWMYRIATNECLTFLEQQKKRTAVSLSDVEDGLANKIKADDNFDAGRLEWQLQLAIQELPERQRLVFNLRYYDEMPYKDMSKILETSEGALKASYHLAAKKIEDFIKNYLNASPNNLS
jgi:RNA polymerase sigma-70 factor (ECF subfamily)